ncbi:MAG: hypothetical protein RSP_17480 [Rhodanobacter sp.]
MLPRPQGRPIAALPVRPGQAAHLQQGSLMKSLMKAAVLALSIVASAAFASPDAAHLPVTHLATLTSTPGETEHAFLLRIAPQLRDYAARTGYQACGLIGTDGHGGLGIELGSNQSHLGCIAHALPEGMTATGESIHGPGKKGGFTMSNTDKVIFAAMDDPHDEVDGLTPDSGILVTMHGQDPNVFSDTDFAAPSYLVTPTALLYQHGRNHVQAIEGEQSALAATP